MAFTPSPGTGDLIDVDPQFSDTLSWDFSLQPTSPCIGSGKDNYDRGAIWYTNRPAAVSQLQILISDSSQQVQINWQNPSLMLDSTALSAPLTALVRRNDSLVAQLTGLAPGAAVQYNDLLPRPENYRYTVSVKSGSGSEGIRRSTAYTWGGGPLEGFVVWALDPNPLSRHALAQTLSQLAPGTPVFISSDANAYDLNPDVRAVFVLLGIHPYDYLLGQGGSNRLILYLNGGGNVYLEGGNFWTDPNQQQLAVHQFFHVQPGDTGQADLTQVEGVPGSLMDGILFSYSGDNQSIDHMNPRTDSQLILRNPADGQGCAVAFDGQGYRTIGASFQFGGLDDGPYPNTKTEYLSRVLEFFNAGTGLSGESPAAPDRFVLLGNYPNPFNGGTAIAFRLNRATVISLQVFNPLGQLVRELAGGFREAGQNFIFFEPGDLGSGVYFYRLTISGEPNAAGSNLGKFIYLK